MFEQKMLEITHQKSKRNRSQLNTAATAPGTAIDRTTSLPSTAPAIVSFSRGNLVTREYPSISEGGEDEQSINNSSHTMSNAGAMVIQKPQSAMSENSQRRFL